VEKGFNSDIHYMGLSFHVQTEDWGLENPFFVSRVYKDGAVVKSIKTSYDEILPNRIHRLPENIRVAMKLQHKKILDLLLSGQLVSL